jgi:acetyltransferase-like isoleucine patch superfamily enzyme
VVGATRVFSRNCITIGDRFLSSWGVFIQDFDPHPIKPEERRLQVEHIIATMRPQFEAITPPPVYASNFPSAPIVIGSDVWIGANATILKGVHIGSGSIVAAGAVVLGGTYPERCVLAGNPARVVRQL